MRSKKYIQIDTMDAFVHLIFHYVYFDAYIFFASHYVPLFFMLTWFIVILVSCTSTIWKNWVQLIISATKYLNKNVFIC